METLSVRMKKHYLALRGEEFTLPSWCELNKTRAKLGGPRKLRSQEMKEADVPTSWDSEIDRLCTLTG